MLLSVCGSATFVILLFAGSSFGLPQSRFAQALIATPPDTIDKYTVAFFLDAVEKQPPASDCVFYTAGLRAKAEAFAVVNSKFTVWDVWPCRYYDRSQVDTNPLRDILKPNPDPHGPNLPDTQTYFEHMSEAYAAVCNDTVLLLTNDTNNVNTQGIWGRVEFPRLQQTGNPGGQVNTVEACDENGANCRVPPFWVRSPSSIQEARRGRISRGRADRIKSQQHQIDDYQDCNPRPNRCFTPEQLEKAFVDIDTI